MRFLTENGNCWTPLSIKMLKENFDYVVNIVKMPLQLAITKASSLLVEKCGEINLDTVKSVNGRNMIAIRDEWLQHEDNGDKRAMMLAAFNIIIAEIEHDWFYDQRFTWAILKISEMVKDGRWEVSHDGIPTILWKR